MLTALARSGYAARGIVFVIVGWFAILAAFGSGRTKGSEDALQTILRQPLGEILVWLMVVALAAFALWRLAQSLLDTDNHGTGGKGLLIRAGLFGSFVAYGLLALFAAGLVTGAGGTAGSGAAGGGDSGLFGQVAGSAWILWIVAAIAAGVGIAHIAKGWRAGFEKYLQAGPDTMRTLRPVARFGLIARGSVFLVIAAIVALGAGRVGGEDAQRPGMEDALNFVQDLPLGWLWLALIGIGLIAFAVYSLAEAVYRRIDLREGEGSAAAGRAAARRAVRR